MANRHNYALKMELKKQNNVAAGLISDRFPAVAGMVIHMTYYRKAANPVLMVRTVNIFPTSYAYFKMDCMIKGCIDGGFDLTSVISTMIKSHRKSERGKLLCNGNIDALASDHASIAYQINIKYNKI